MDLGIHLVYKKKDALNDLTLEGWVDADHAGDVRTARSTSGWFVAITGDSGTFIPLDWGSKLQSVSAKSTGEAEISAFNDILTRSYLTLLYVVMLMISLKGRRINCDSSAALQAIKNGLSVAMRYIKKHQRVSIAFMHDAMKVNEIEAAKIETLLNFVDALTEELGRIKYAEFRQKVNTS